MSTQVSFLHLYSQNFSTFSDLKTAFNSEEKIFATPLSIHEVDFAIYDITMFDTAIKIAKKVANFAVFAFFFYSFAGLSIHQLIFQFSSRMMKLLPRIGEIASKSILFLPVRPRGNLTFNIILLVWVHETLRYIVQRFVMLPFYPAQSSIYQWMKPSIHVSTLNGRRKEIAKNLKNNGFIVRDIALEKNGVKYSGLMIGHEDTFTNHRWVIQATGNVDPIERTAEIFAKRYKKYQYNTVMIQWPCSGKKSRRG